MVCKKDNLFQDGPSLKHQSEIVTRIGPHGGQANNPTLFCEFPSKMKHYGKCRRYKNELLKVGLSGIGRKKYFMTQYSLSALEKGLCVCTRWNEYGNRGKKKTMQAANVFGIPVRKTIAAYAFQSLPQ